MHNRAKRKKKIKKFLPFPVSWTRFIIHFFFFFHLTHVLVPSLKTLHFQFLFDIIFNFIEINMILLLLLQFFHSFCLFPIVHYRSLIICHFKMRNIVVNKKKKKKQNFFQAKKRIMNIEHQNSMWSITNIYNFFFKMLFLLLLRINRAFKNAKQKKRNEEIFHFYPYGLLIDSVCHLSWDDSAY